MTLIDFVNGLAAKGVELWVTDGKLQYKAPKEVMTPALLAELKEKKPEIIALLQEFAASTGTYPLSYSQKSLWSLHQLNPESAAYNVMYAARLTDQLDLPALQRCVDYLIARHPILRTRYAVIDGEPQQKVDTAPATTLAVHEVQEVDLADIDTWIDQEANRPFDLTASPIRLQLLVNDGNRRSAVPRHVLLISVHHIAADFWSLEIFVRELAGLYRLALAGEPLKLPPLPLQYKDYVAHEQQRLQSDAGRRLAAFWAQELAGEPVVLDLPADHLRPPVKTENGRVHALELSPELSALVKDAARAAGATPYMLLLAVYQLFLFQHSGQSRLLIGAPTAGRNLPGSEAVMGHFVNTTVLHCRPHGARSFAELLADTRAMMVRVLEHQDYPFPLLVERLRPPRDPSRSPVFQVMYNWNQAHRDGQAHLEGDGDGLVTAMLAASSTGTRGATHDLTLNIYDYGRHYTTAWTYNTDLFEAATIESFAAQYRRLLEQVLADAGRPLAEYRLPDPAEQARRVDAALTAIGHGEPRAPAALTAQLLSYAHKHPDRAAWTHSASSLSYGDVAVAVLSLRARLAQHSVTARSRIGIAGQDTLQQAIAALALLELGADIHCLADEAAAAPANKAPPAVDLVIDSVHGADPLQLQLRVQPAPPQPDRPLATAFRWQAAQCAEAITGLQQVLQLAGGTRVLALAGRDPRYALLEALAVLVAGGSLQSTCGLDVARLAAGQPMAIEKLRNTLHDAQVAVLALPAPLVNAVPASPALQTLLLLGHSAVPPGGPVPALEVLLSPPFWLSVGSPPLAFRAERGHWRLTTRAAGAAALVLGRQREVVDAGGQGRLAVLLPGRTPPTLAPAADLPDCSRVPGSRVGASPQTVLLLAPLLVCLQRDGRIELQGRVDRIAPHRLAPFALETVEAVLADEVQRPVICATPAVGGEPVLVAYLQGSADAAREETLRRRLKQRLPDYQHPKALVWVDHFPLAADGSIDLGQLPLPRITGDCGYTAPRTPVEAALAGIWREVLGFGQVGIHDNFFELGGDSILGAVIISKASQQQLFFSPKDIFENNTIAELAAVVRSESAVLVDQGPVTGEAPLTPIEHWFFERIITHRHHFNQALLLSLSAPPDPAVMAQALSRLADQHDVLRARFIQRDGQWRQSFDAPLPDAPLCTVQSCTPDTLQAAIDHAQQQLDLEHGPLYRAVWLDCGELAASRLLLVVHHLAVDGVSWSILLDDLNQLYTALSAGQAPELPPKTSSYKTWAERLQAYAASPALDEDFAWWRRYVDTANAAHAGFGGSLFARRLAEQPENRNRVADAGQIRVTLDPAQTAAFRGPAHQAYLTDAGDLLAAALYAGFSTWNGHPLLQLALEGHGREPVFDDVDLGRTVGWFTSIYPVLFELDDASRADPGRLLKAVKQQLRDTPRKGFGYSVLRYLRGREGAALGKLPKSPILFTYLGALDHLVAGRGLFAGAIEPAGGLRSPQQSRTHLFDICAYIANERLTLDCVYDQTLFSAAEAGALMEAIRAALARLVEHCLDPAAGGMTPSDLPDIDVDQEGLDALLDELALLDE